MADEFADIEDDEDSIGGAPAEVPEPRANPYLAGHAAAEAALLEAHAQGKLPHAVIIGGPRGIGKATLAFRLARFLRALIDRLDQRAPYPLAPRRLVGEQILQIADRSDHRGVAMKKIVNETKKPSVLLGDERMDRLIGIEET